MTTLYLEVKYKKKEIEVLQCLVDDQSTSFMKADKIEEMIVECKLSLIKFIFSQSKLDLSLIELTLNELSETGEQE